MTKFKNPHVNIESDKSKTLKFNLNGFCQNLTSQLTPKRKSIKTGEILEFELFQNRLYCSFVVLSSPFLAHLLIPVKNNKFVIFLSV